MNIKDKLKEISKHFLIYGMGSIAQSLAGFILLPIITSRLTPEIYGAYTIINLVGILAGTVFYFGITSALPRSYFDYEEESQRQVVLSTSFFLILSGALLQSLLAWFGGKNLSLYFFGNDSYSKHLFWMLVATAIGFLNTFFQTYFRLLHKSKTVVSLGIIASFINIICVYFFLTNYSLGIWAPILGYLIGQTVIFLITLIAIRKTLIFKISPHEVKLLLKFGIPTIMASFAVMGIEWSDRFFINKYLTLADVGIYSLGYKIGSIVNALYVTPFTQIWNPIMMKYRNSEGVKELFKKVLTYYFIAGVVFLLLSTSILNELVYLLVKNPAYFRGVLIAPIIMGGVLIYGATNILTAGLFFSRQVHVITWIYGFVAGLNLLLNYFLISNFGYVGAAWSSFVTYLFVPPLIYLQSKQHFHFEIEYKRLSALLLITTLSSTLMIQVESLPTLYRISWKVLICLSSLTSILIFVVSKEERDSALNFLKKVKTKQL